MKNKLQVGDKVKLKGNPLDEQLGECLDTEKTYTVIETSKTVPCGSGLAVKIGDDYHDWLDSVWFTVVKRRWQK